LAEEIYKSVDGEKESVHLDGWPEVGSRKSEEKLFEEMEKVRKIVSLALEARAKANIKIRQPLALLKIRNPKSEIRNKPELLNLINEEINVKKIIFDEEVAGEVELDTAITPELKEEGEFRGLLRAVQNLRKKKGLTISDVATLLVDTSADGKRFVEKFSSELKKSALLKDIEFVSVAYGEAVAVGEHTAKLDIRK